MSGTPKRLYPGAQNATATNSESILKEIVERTFCLIFVFSKADKKDEIEAILAKPEFQLYKERLQYLDKAKDGAEQTGIPVAAAALPGAQQPPVVTA